MNDDRDKKRSRPLRKWALRCIGLFILALIVFRIGREALLAELRSADWLLVALSALLCGLHFMAKALRWNCILRKQGVRAGYIEVLKAYCAAALVGMLTPGRVGELSKAAFVREWDEEASWGTALGTVVLDRIIDVGAFALVAFWGLVWVGLPGEYRVTGEIAAILLLVIGFASSFMGWHRIVQSRYWEKLREFAYSKIGVGASDFYQVFKQLKPANVFPLAVWTAVAYGLFFLHFGLLGHALGSELPIKVLAWGISLASLGAVLPISVSGIGVRDFILLAVFQTWHEIPARVIAISLTYLGILYVVIALMGIWPFIFGDMEFKSVFKRQKRENQRDEPDAASARN